MYQLPTLDLKANVYCKFANFDSNQQKSPTIAHTEIEQFLKKPLVLHYLAICHSQCVEQHTKFVAEATAQVERFDQQRDESFNKKIKSRKLTKTFDTKNQFN